MEKRFIYADNAATTPMSETAFKAMEPWLRERYGNPSSVYRIARESRLALENARRDVAECLGAKPTEIYFTSGGTEGDNWAIKGALLHSRRKEVIISNVEHHAVLHSALAMEKYGYKVTQLPVRENGIVSPDDLRKLISEDTAIVSVMLANNEIGTIQPVAELAAIAHEHGALMHTDAVQAAGHIPIDVGQLGVDILTISAHKFHGPKGVGAQYIRTGVRITNLIDGGGHERGRRSGTENVASAVALAAALKEATETLPERMPRLTALRDRLIDGLLKIPYVQLTCDPVKRLPATVSVVINAVEGEGLILTLDELGVCASSGSACTSGSLDPSHVLLAVGLKHEVAHGSLRLTLPDDIDEDGVDYLIWAVKSAAERMRQMSPVWDSVAGRPV